MGKILVICGPTATGKTSLALKMAKMFNGEIISADSRQVYRNMDIGTGKDLPKGIKIQYPKGKNQNNSQIGGFYKIDKVRVWCYDLVDINQKFSVSDYVSIAELVIFDIQKRGKLPIICGGSGFYIKELLDRSYSVSIGINKSLRRSLIHKDPETLFRMLGELDFKKANSLNDSDKKNPRRLVRAIEVAKYLRTGASAKEKSSLYDKNSILTIGLMADKKVLEENIRTRVGQRFESGFLKEMENLLKIGFTKSPQARFTLGYRQYVENDLKGSGLNDFFEKWVIAERKYSKKQLTWFKKIKGIKWFDVGLNNQIENIEKTIRKWYHL